MPTAYTRRSALQEPETIQEHAALFMKVQLDTGKFMDLIMDLNHMIERITTDKEVKKEFEDITKELFRLNKSIDADHRKLGKYEGRVAERKACIIRNTTRKSPKKGRSRSTL